MSLETLKFCKASVMVAISVLKRALNGTLFCFFFEIKNWPRCNKTCGLLQNVALFSLDNTVLKLFKHISNNFCGKYCKDKQSLILCEIMQVGFFFSIPNHDLGTALQYFVALF